MPGLLGWTDPRNTVEVDGAPIALDDRGAIVVPVDPSRERVTHAVLIRNPEGLTRIVNLNVNRSERDESGGRWLVHDRIPAMRLRLPPAELELVVPRLRFSGETPQGLRQNQRLSTRIVLEQREGVLKVQRGAFLDTGGGRVAYVVQDDVAVRRPIRTGASSVSEVEILEGLEPGERIIISNLGEFERVETVRLAD